MSPDERTPADDASWLVLTDKLTEEGNPLGEYIVLTLKYLDGTPMPDGKKRRQGKLGRDWRARWVPGAKWVSWYRTGLTLGFKTTEDLLAHADELRRIGLPLALEVGTARYSTTDKCFFDADFTRLACVHSSVSVTNQNHSPGMDEEWHHWRDVTVWRVADRAVLLKRGFSGTWSRLEFRADGLYALEGKGAVHLEGT